MALTITFPTGARNLNGQKREVTFDFVFDSSYPNTGATVGEPLTAANLGLTNIESIDFVESPDGYVFSYDRANAVVHAFYADYDAGADGGLIEVPDGTNIATVNGRATARGF